MHNDRSDVIDLCDELERCYISHQFIITLIIVPADDRQAIFRLELVAVWGIINNDYIFHIAPNSCHILDKLPIEKGAMLAEEALGSYFFRIKDVHQWDCILGETSREDDDLEVFAYFNDELAATRSHLDIDIARATLNINR